MTRIGQQSPFLHGIPVVLSSAQRDQLYPSPDTHQRVYNLATHYIERWDGANWLQEASTLGGIPVFNVVAFGAKGDGVADDGAAIRAAISAANLSAAALQGGIVYFPPGKYLYTGTLQIPVSLNQGQIILKGSGMRCTYLVPGGASTSFSGTGTSATPSCLVFGALVPDASGTFTNQTQYCGMEDLSILGSAISSGSVRAVVLTEMQNGWLQNVIIEQFPNASVGLYLRGATVSGGLGASVTAPHVRQCRFTNVIITTIGSNNLGGRACVLQNADENLFEQCTFGCTAGQTVSANSILTMEVRLARNNNWVKCLWSGDFNATKSGYAGAVFGPPLGEDGTSQGSVIGNKIDGSSVAEGFSICFWIKADSSGNTLGNIVYGYPSTYTTDWQDDTQPTNPGGFTNGGQGGNAFLSPALGREILGAREPAAPGCVLLNNSTTPSVTGSNLWTASNSSATIITDFLNGIDGQRLKIRATNGNTTIRDANNGGGGNIRNFGRQDIVLAANWSVLLQRDGGIWYQVSPVRFEGGFGNPTGAALGTTAVRGFSYIPTCAGTPTGVPVELPTGSVPMVFDTTGVKLWIYTGGAWKGVVVA